jgi:methyl-accepting chemotaxis protein
MTPEKKSKNSFVFCVGLGAISLYVLAMNSDPNTSEAVSWLPAIFVTLIMFGYAYFAKEKTPEVYRTKDFADSFYYLGFIFTVASLIVTLRFMGDEPTNTFVLSQFGVALFTTLIGLTGKLYFALYLKSEPDRIEDLIHQAEMALQAVSEQGDKYRMMLQAVTNNTETALKTATQTLGLTIENLATPLTQPFEDIANNFSNVQDRIRQSHENLEVEIAGLGTQLTSSVESLTSALRESQEESESIGELFPEVRTNLEQLTEAFQNVTSEINSSKNAFGTLIQESTSTLGTSAEVVARSAESLDQVISGMLTQTTGGREAISEGVAASTESIRQYATELREAAEALREVAVGPWKEATDFMVLDSERFSEAVQQASVQMDGLTSSTARMTQGEEQTAEALVNVKNELTQAVRALKEELEG